MEFIKRGQPQFKANLHCHSTLSDGKLTPDQLVEAYRRQGYSILAITDHEAPYDHSGFSGADFLLLTGYEAHIRPEPVGAVNAFGPEIHMNLIAKKPHNTAFIAFDPDFCRHMPPEIAASREKLGNLGPRQYMPGYIRAFIALAQEGGYLVTYNHPCWSMEDPSDVASYDGFFSIEVFNTSSAVSNSLEYNMALYDTLLRKGRRIYCHGVDDNHNRSPLGTPQSDSFGSWTMILAEELTYPAVIRALEKGQFYASTGPRIEVLGFDGARVHLEFSPSRKAIMHMSPKRTQVVCSDRGDPICAAEFLIPDYAPYVYFTIEDSRGNRAHVRAFTREELGS